MAQPTTRPGPEQPADLGLEAQKKEQGHQKSQLVGGKVEGLEEKQGLDRLAPTSWLLELC